MTMTAAIARDNRKVLLAETENLRQHSLMAYDEHLAERVRSSLKRQTGITEKKMFGGIGFMLHGNMACGIVGEKLMLRLGEDGAKRALEEEHVTPMDFTGKPIKTMAFVQPEGIETDAELKRWVIAAVTFAKTLPPKQ